MAGDDSAGDDEEVVDQRAEGGKKKKAMGEENCGDDASDIKENLRWEKDAREMHTELHLLGREAGNDAMDQLRGEDFCEDGSGDQNRGHYGDDDGESFLRVLLALFSEEPRVDGDEGDRGRASGDDVVEKIGQGEGSSVGVDQLSRSEGIGDIGFANVSDDAGER